MSWLLPVVNALTIPICVLCIVFTMKNERTYKGLIKEQRERLEMLDEMLDMDGEVRMARLVHLHEEYEQKLDLMNKLIADISEHPERFVPPRGH